MATLRTNLWFDTEAEEAARFYMSIFRDGKLGTITYYPNVGQEVHGKPEGSVLTVDFEILGQPFVALNGGTDFTFNESVSIIVECTDQAEVDYYWEKLSEGGDPTAQQCGWLKDRYGLSWQVIPEGMEEMWKSPDTEKVERAFAAMMEMKKLDLGALQRAFAGRA
jgi:predicted 3-demethylubiquinone-9 3-methyltransferase (glyoxalase superfamily)